MEKKNLRDVPANIRDMYNRALTSADDPKNVDYAITLLADVVRRVPALAVARQKLRELEMKKKPGLFGKMKASQSSKKNLPKIQDEMTRSPLRALIMCEEEFAKNLNNPPVVRLMIAAARALKADFIEIEGLELLTHYQPGDDDMLKRLAELYHEAGENVKRSEILTNLANKYPDDYQLQALAKSAMNVINSRNQDEEARQAREKFAANRENLTVQLSDGTIHDERQARILIERLSVDVERSNSLDVRRKLAEAYLVAKDYDSAIEQLEKVAASLGTADPALDKTIESAYVAKFDSIISELEANPQDYENAEQQVAEFKTRRDNFRFERAESRLKTYPNDAQLQFDYAELCYSHNRLNEAVKYFEESVQTHRLRIPSLVYLGRCAIRYRDYDAAINYLNTAVGELGRMDKRKMEATYYLALALEHAERLSEAIALFEDLIAANPTYRDVAARLEGHKGA